MSDVTDCKTERLMMQGLSSGVQDGKHVNKYIPLEYWAFKGDKPS